MSSEKLNADMLISGALGRILTEAAMRSARLDEEVTQAQLREDARRNSRLGRLAEAVRSARRSPVDALRAPIRIAQALTQAPERVLQRQPDLAQSAPIKVIHPDPDAVEEILLESQLAVVDAFNSGGGSADPGSGPDVEIRQSPARWLKRSLVEVDPATYPVGTFQRRLGQAVLTGCSEGHVVAFSGDNKKPWYVGFEGTLPLEEVSSDGATIYLSLDAEVMAGVFGVHLGFSDERGEPLPGRTYRAGQVHRIDAPSGAVSVRIAFTMRGDGVALVRSIRFSSGDSAAGPVFELVERNVPVVTEASAAVTPTIPSAVKSQTLSMTAIIPMFRVADYLPDLLDSLAGQEVGRYTLECIFVDDGSPDESAKMAAHWLKTTAAAEGITGVVLHQENSGPSVARNRGMDAAEGEWITFPDPDDVLSENFFRAVAEFILDCGEQNLAIIDTPVIRWQEHGCKTEGRVMLPHKYVKGSRIIDLAQYPDFIRPHAVPSFFRRELLDAAGHRWEPSLRSSEDMLLVASVLASVDRPLCGIVADVAYYYRRRATANSLSNQTWQHPERTLSRFQLCYVPLSERFSDSDGFVPTWLANHILYDFKWLFDREVSPATRLKLNSVELSRIRALMKMVLQRMRTVDIRNFNVVPLSETVRAAMLSIRDGDWADGLVQVISADASGGTVTLAHRSSAHRPVPTLTINKAPVTPLRVIEQETLMFGQPVLVERMMDVRVDGQLSVTRDGRVLLRQA